MNTKMLKGYIWFITHLMMIPTGILGLKLLANILF